jgi:hypothetical protein
LNLFTKSLGNNPKLLENQFQQQIKKEFVSSTKSKYRQMFDSFTKALRNNPEIMQFKI